MKKKKKNLVSVSYKATISKEEEFQESVGVATP